MNRLVPCLSLLLACSENRLHAPEPPPPAEPPGETIDAFGNAPDWATCGEAYYGQYYNLSDNSDALEVGDDGPAVVDPDAVDWWDDGGRAFDRADTSLVMGSSWWPVDEGLSGDPENFAVRWTAWARAEQTGDVVFALTAATDAWVKLGDDEIAQVEAAPEAESATFTVSVRSGVYPLDIHFAQRVPRESAFRFRVVSGAMVVCYPDFAVEDSGG